MKMAGIEKPSYRPFVALAHQFTLAADYDEQLGVFWLYWPDNPKTGLPWYAVGIQDPEDAYDNCWTVGVYTGDLEPIAGTLLGDETEALITAHGFCLLNRTNAR